MATVSDDICNEGERIMRSILKRTGACILLLLLLTASAASAAPVNKANSTLKKKMDLVIQKAKITDDMTNVKKLDALFKRIGNKENYQYYRVTDFKLTASGWANEYALYMLKNRRGSCYHHAATFAFLAKRATSLPVRICCGKAKIYSTAKSAHAWAEVKISGKWYIYDTNAGAFAGEGTWKKLSVTSSRAKKLYFPSKKLLLP